jgi:uncharacterized protein YcaQ
VRRLSSEQARRLSLGIQGFGRDRPAGRVDRRHLRRAMDDMRVLQLDSVNVCVRSHYMPLFSRLGPYPQSLIDELAYRDREYFEYWGHEASFVPARLYPAMRHRMERLGGWRAVRQVMEEHPGFIEAVEEEVHRHGPLSVGDLSDPGERTGPWWGYGKGKLALEYLFAKGRVGVHRRESFTRYYSAPHHVVPEDHFDAEPLDRDAAFRALILDGLRGLGVGTAEDIADYWRLHRPTMRPILEAMADAGDVERVEVDGWDKPGFIDGDATIPRSISGRALLSPFDPVVWNRDRAERIFGFRYRIEIYVPEPKREFGYYVYPFLLDGELVGRVDLKAHRDRGVLEAKASWVEDGRDPVRVARELAAELAVMAEWLGLERVEVVAKGTLAPHLARFA